MSWNASIEITGQMLTQTNMSGLGVLLIINKYIQHVWSCVCSEKKRKEKKKSLQCS